MMDELFALSTCYQESLLQTNITEAYKIGAKQLSVNYIYNNVKSLLTMVYCIMQKQFAYVLAAIKEERSQNPQAAKKFKVFIFPNLYKISNKLKARMDVFLGLLRRLIDALFGDGLNAKKMIAAAAPILEARANESGKNIARMMFRGMQQLADHVYDASVEIAKINRNKNMQRL